MPRHDPAAIKLIAAQQEIIDALNRRVEILEGTNPSEQHRDEFRGELMSLNLDIHRLQQAATDDSSPKRRRGDFTAGLVRYIFIIVILLIIIIATLVGLDVDLAKILPLIP